MQGQDKNGEVLSNEVLNNFVNVIVFIKFD